MLDLGDVLEFIIDGLYDSPLSSQQSVRHTHQCPFHVAFEFCYQLDAVNEEALEEFLANISFVSNELAIQEFYEGLVLKRLAVIDIARSNHEVEHFSLLIADEVQLKSEEPAHRALSPLGYTFERPVNMDALILADPEWCAVNETDTCAFAQQHFLDEKGQGNSNLLLQFHKAVIRYQFWEQVAEMVGNMLQIEMLQATVARAVKQNHNHHDFCLGKSTITVIFPLFCLFNGIFCHHCIIKFAKIICHTENFSNFVLGKH